MISSIIYPTLYYDFHLNRGNRLKKRLVSVIRLNITKTQSKTYQLHQLWVETEILRQIEFTLTFLYK